MHFDQHNGIRLFVFVVFCVCCMLGSVYTYGEDDVAGTDLTGDNVYNINSFLSQYEIDRDHLVRNKRLQKMKRQQETLRGLEDQFRELRNLKDEIEKNEDETPAKQAIDKVSSGVKTSRDDSTGDSDEVKIPESNSKSSSKTNSNKHVDAKNEGKLMSKTKTLQLNEITDKSTQDSKHQPQKDKPSDASVLESPWKQFREAVARYNASVNYNRLHNAMAAIANTNAKNSETNDDTTDNENEKPTETDNEYDEEEDDDRRSNPVLKNISLKKLDMVVPFDRSTEGDFKDHMMWIGIGTALSTVITFLLYLAYRLIIHYKRLRSDFIKDISLGGFTDHKLDQNPMYVRLSQVHNPKTGNHYVVSILDDKKEENGWSSEEEEVFNISAIKDQKNSHSTPIKSMTTTPDINMTTSTPRQP